MEFGVREWLLIIGALLAVAVLLDGYRRMKKDRGDSIRLSPKRNVDDEDLLNPELPGGSARVVAVRERASLHERRAPTIETVAEDEAPDESAAATLSELDEQVSVAVESVDDILFSDPREEYAREVPQKSKAAAVAASPVEPTMDLRSEAAPRVGAEAKPEKKPAKAKASRNETVSSDDSEYSELIVLNVMTQPDQPFKGSDLLQILLACDVRYGKMNIFHRYENADGTGPVQFSIANLVEPGTFDLDEIDDFTTPGLLFFMNLPGPKNSVKAFDAMLETARCVVKNLGGELKDQTQSVATKQTLEHYKQRIRDFERRQLTLM